MSNISPIKKFSDAKDIPVFETSLFKGKDKKHSLSNINSKIPGGKSRNNFGQF
jgi:hypothetical protein